MNPWYVAAFLGREPALSAPQRRTLLLVCVACVFGTFEIAFLNAALPQVARDLDMSTADTGFYLGAIRAGGFGTLFILPVADRLGRWPVLSAAVVALGLGSLVTALSPSAPAFVAAQVVTFAVALAIQALAVVLVVEQLSARSHGAAVGMLMVLGGVGHGVAALL